MMIHIIYIYYIYKERKKELNKDAEMAGEIQGNRLVDAKNMNFKA